MTSLLFSAFIFIVWATTIIVTYTSNNTSHQSLIAGADGYIGYVFVLIAVYSAYKIWSLMRSKEKVSWHLGHLLGYFFLQLFLVSLFYTSSIGKDLSYFFTSAPSGFTLFFHSVTLLLYPLFLAFLWRAVGASILGWIKKWQDHPLRLRVPAETALGLGIFGAGLLFLGGIGHYTFTGLAIFVGILVLASYQGWKMTYRDIRNSRIVYDQHAQKGTWIDRLQPQLLSAEFAFIIWSFVASVALINAIRPMPIGWDDLGVYMNFPKIMAHTGESILGAGMYTWQLITGTGFLFDHIAAQAFYVNQL